jgi:hypothetical protein
VIDDDDWKSFLWFMVLMLAWTTGMIFVLAMLVGHYVIG